MPGLNYKTMHLSTGAFPSTVAAARFYDGTPGRELVRCPDCGCPADALFGNHGGPALCRVVPPRPRRPRHAPAPTPARAEVA